MTLASSRNGLTRGVVGRGKAAADVEQVHLGVAAVAGLLEDVRGQVDGGDVVLEIRRLAADVEAEALDDQARPCRPPGSGPPPRPGDAPNLDDSSTIAPVLGTFSRSASPACGACFLILWISS